MPTTTSTRAALAGAALLACASAYAADSPFIPSAVYGTLGYSEGALVSIFAAGASWDLKKRPPARDESGLGIRLDGQVGYWEGKGKPTPYGHVWDFSATPIFRWTFEKPAAPRLFVEGGLGFHLLSATRINNDRIFSTAFQFGEMAGVGTSFGARNEYEVRLFVQHVSNGRIKTPNWGLTYPGITLSYALP
jgi:lipid A 3-O-deacylase